MDNSKRIVLNTAVQYVKTLISLLLTLYSTRIILEALGASDYGLYSVIAGVVSMLGFITNSLVISTQRYLSYYKGVGDSKQVGIIFENSLFVHFILGLAVLIILLACSNVVVRNVLTVSVDREYAATIVFITVSCIITLSFITSPFRALFVARENIVYISIIDILDSILKVLIAFFILNTSVDKLILYGVLMLGISIVNLLAFCIYAFRYYEECQFPKRRNISLSYIKRLSSFASWTLFSTGCVIGRTQGLAILFNNFYGSLVNAAYGIAQQVSGAIMNVAQAIANAMSPQIIKSEGEGNRTRMIDLAGIECMLAYSMLSVAAIPVIVQMPFVLGIWLVDVPDNTVLFCRFFILSCLFDQLTAGLGVANQASGKIKNYSVFFGLVKLLTLPISYILITLGYSLLYVLLCFVALELISALLRIVFLNKSIELNIKYFIKRFLLPIIVASVMAFLVCSIISPRLPSSICSLLVLYVLNILVIVFALISLLQKDDRIYVWNVIKKITDKAICFKR